MVAITIKPAKENSKTRKFKRTGEFFAAKDANRVLASRIEAAFTKLSEGCTARVYKATMPVPVRSTEQLTELKFKPHNKVKNPLGQQVNARQKMRGKSIPLI
ncbi:TPA: hypothetical protein ACGJN9_001417 [Yersinia enterocolitica]